MFAAMRKYWPVNLIVGCLLAIMAVITFLPPRKGIAEDTICILIYCSAFIVVGSLFSVFLCRSKARHQEQISYATVLPTGFVVAVMTTMSGSLVVHGTRVFTADYWSLVWHQWLLVWLGLWLLGFVVSLLAVFGIVVYYKRQQKDYTHMA
jgi:hypothetical protein